MRNIYLLSGEDSFRLALTCQEIQAKLSKSSAEKKLDIVKIEEIEALTSLAFSRSLFGNRKLILLELNQINNLELEKAIKLLKRQELPESVFLLFYKTGKLDKRLKSTKELEKLAQEQFLLEPFSPWNLEKITNWIESFAKKKNIKIESKAAFKLAEFHQNDTARIASSLFLLDLSFQKEGELIKLELVQELCSQDYNIFLVIDLFFLEDFPRFQTSLRELLSKQSPFQILAALQSIFDYFLDLKDLQENEGCSIEQISKKLMKHPFKVKQDFLKLKKWFFQDLLKIYRELNRLESQAKSGDLRDLKQALRFLFLKNQKS